MTSEREFEEWYKRRFQYRGLQERWQDTIHAIEALKIWQAARQDWQPIVDVLNEAKSRAEGKTPDFNTMTVAEIQDADDAYYNRLCLAIDALSPAPKGGA